MHYILAVRLEGFYLSAHACDQAGPSAVAKDKHLIEVNAAARARSLLPGMSVTEAKSLVNEARIFLWDLPRYEKRMPEWLDFLAEWSSAVEPTSPATAFLDLTGFPGASEVPKALRARLPYAAFIGVGPNRWLAKAALAETSESQPTFDACRGLDSFLSRLPLDQFSPALPEQRRTLQLLGYRTLGEVRSISRSVMQDQFCEDGKRLFHAAQGGGDTTIREVYPPDALDVSFTFPGGTEDREVIVRGLSALAARAHKILKKRDASGRTVHLTLEIAEGERLRLSRTFTRNIQTEDVLTAALLSFLGDFPDAELERVRLQMPGLARARSIQPELNPHAATVADLNRVDHAVSKVKAAFGDGVVLSASEKKEPRRKKVLRAWGNVTGWC